MGDGTFFVKNETITFYFVSGKNIYIYVKLYIAPKLRLNAKCHMDWQLTVPIDGTRGLRNLYDRGINTTLTSHVLMILHTLTYSICLSSVP